MPCPGAKTQDYGYWVNSLPNIKLLYSSKLKAFADSKLNIAKMMIYLFEKVKNIVGKGENPGYQHFLLYQQCFLKSIFLSVISWLFGCIGV